MTLIKSISGIRGTIGGRPGDNLTPLDIVKFTTAYVRFLGERKQGRLRIVVGRDARLSGEMVGDLIEGALLGCGADVVNVGLCTTPGVELAVTAHEADGGIIITASHNPRQWNALKLLDADGEFLSDAEGKRVLELAERSDFEFPEVDALGHVLSRESFNDEHIRRVLALPLVDVDAVRRKRFKVVVDAVNSVGGIVIPKLLRELGCEVVELNCEPTGEFAHNPEPLPENLTEIAAAVVREKADLGVVVDPDVDRLAFVSEDGSMFVEEYTLVAVADYVLSHRKGRYGLEPQFVAGAARCDRASWRPLSRFGRGRSQRRGEDEGGRRRHRRRRQRRRDLSRTALRPRRAGGRGAVPDLSGADKTEDDRIACHLPPPTTRRRTRSP